MFSYRHYVIAIACLLTSLVAVGQDLSPDRRPRFLVHGEIGDQSFLGYLAPSKAFGIATEIPIGKDWEFQIGSMFSPDKKAITHDGMSAQVNSSIIRFVNKRVGVIGGVERNWLWTSQFDKRAWHPSAGIVLRNGAFGAGRIYIRYLFPMGCVWASAENPCRMQSSRLQGVELYQEFRFARDTRLGYRSGLYHFCDQSNPLAPQLGRNCHIGFTSLLFVRFEFHMGKLSEYASRIRTDQDLY